tara:strand:+ start:246 stop:1256 length:1011 start_codon:yes stop_codon:yes gene_type:complete
MPISTIPISGLGSDASNQGVNFKNYVINGDLSVAQRGTSFTNVASGTYTIDRWNMSYRAVGNADIAQVDNKTYKSLKVTNSNASSQEIAMRYRVEDVTQFHNDSFVLSFYAKASTSVTLDTRVFENYGSGGSSTVTVVSAGSQNKTITTTRQRFSITFTTSDMSSKTIGTSNYLEFSFHPTLVSGANWEYDSVQLEKGTSATDFERIPYDLTFQRCQRYHFRHNPTKDAHVGVLVGFANGGSDINSCTVPVPVPMRANPSLSTDPASGSIAVRYFTPEQGTGTISSYTTLASQGDCASDGSGYLALTLNGFGGGLDATSINGIEFESTCLILDAEL